MHSSQLMKKSNGTPSRNASNNRIEINFHKNPLNARLPRGPKFEIKTLQNNGVTSPLRSPINATGSSSLSMVNMPVSRPITMSPFDPFTRSPNRTFLPPPDAPSIRQFNPNALPKITPNSFLGDMPRVNLAGGSLTGGDRFKTRPLLGPRTASRFQSQRSTGFSGARSTYSTGGISFVNSPVSFNFSANANNEIIDERNRSLYERPLSRTSDVSNISVNSAISSRQVPASFEEDAEEKKRRLMDAIRMKDARRWRNIRSNESTCTDPGIYSTNAKRKRGLEMSNEEEEDDSKHELSEIFGHQPKRKLARPNIPMPKKSFKNNEILSSYTSIVHISNSQNKQTPITEIPKITIDAPDNLELNGKTIEEKSIEKNSSEIGSANSTFLSVDSTDSKLNDKLVESTPLKTPTVLTKKTKSEECVFKLPEHLPTMEDHQRDESKFSNRVSRFLQAIYRNPVPKEPEKKESASQITPSSPNSSFKLPTISLNTPDLPNPLSTNGPLLKTSAITSSVISIPSVTSSTCSNPIPSPTTISSTSAASSGLFSGLTPSLNLFQIGKK